MLWSLPAPPCLLLQLAFVRHLLSKLLCFLQLPLLCWDHEVAGLFHWCCEDSRTAMQLLFFTAKAKTVLSCLCTIVIVFWNWEEFHMYVSNPCFLFSLCNIDLFWILTFFFFSPVLKGDEGEGEIYSSIQNSSQVPALIKPCEAHYWGCEGCCFCPHFTPFCQAIASRNMQSVQSSCSTPVIGVNWGCSNSSTSAFLLLSIGFSTLISAANPPWGHWVHWIYVCGVIKKQFGYRGEILPKHPLKHHLLWSNGDKGSDCFQAFLFSEFPYPLKLMLLFYISQVTVLGCGTENQQCSCLLLSLLPSVSQESPLSFVSSDEFLQEDG